MVIRPTEDSRGYSYLFKFAAEILPREHFFTIISDMAKCINSAAMKCFRSFQLHFCFYHLKENLIKKLPYVPSKAALNSIQQFMRGEISYETFYATWTDEESQYDTTLQGWDWISQNACHISPTHKTLKLGIVSSQRSESLHSHVKINGSSAIDMLRRYVSVSTEWFKESAELAGEQNNFLTDYAEDILNNNIQAEFKLTGIDKQVHFQLDEDTCACFQNSDMGIPCPYTIRLIRQQLDKEFQQKRHNPSDAEELPNEEEDVTEEAPSPLMQAILEKVHVRWHTHTAVKAFGPFIDFSTPECAVTTEDHVHKYPTTKDWDILGAKCSWLINNDPEFREELEKLVRDREQHVVIPFIQHLKPKPKKKKSRRHLSALEAHALKKQHGEIMEVLSKHINGAKITKANLLLLYRQIRNKKPDISDQLSEKSTKNAIIKWFKKNFHHFISVLGSVPCLTPEGDVISETEEEI